MNLAGTLLFLGDLLASVVGLAADVVGVVGVAGSALFRFAAGDDLGVTRGDKVMFWNDGCCADVEGCCDRTFSGITKYCCPVALSTM